MNFYNVYIEHESFGNYGGDRDYIIALNEEQLNTIVTSYLKGSDRVMVKGVNRNIRNPLKFLIYSITERDRLGNEQAEIERNLQKEKMSINRGQMSLKVFATFGTNVTDNFTKCKGWGSLANNQPYFEDTPLDANKGFFTHENDNEPFFEAPDMEEFKKGKIFISHAVADSKLVQAFTEHILEIGLGLNAKNDIFNISIEDAGIISGEKFKERIEKELKNSKAVIQIITENYKKSEACLNEMGAAWILDTKVVPFLLEPISYNTVGFIHNTTQLLKIDSKIDIKKFVANYKGELFDLNYNDGKLDRKIDEFLEVVKKRNIPSIDIKENITDSHIEQAYKSFQTDNPFIKINNHSNVYYYKDRVFHEIQDNYTLMFLGYDKYSKTLSMNLTLDELKRNLREPVHSILNSEIWVAGNDNKQWLIYNGLRHHILDDVTLLSLKKGKGSELNYKNVTKSDLEKIIQGDAFTLKNKIE